MLARQILLDQQRTFGQAMRGVAQAPARGTRRAARAGTTARGRRRRRRARRAARARRPSAAPLASPRRRRPATRYVRPQQSGRVRIGVVRARPCDRDPPTGRFKHRDRGVRILRLEVFAERVDEQHDVGGIGAGAFAMSPARTCRGESAAASGGAESPHHDSDSRAAPGSVSRRFASHGHRAAHGAQRGRCAITRSLSEIPCARCHW